MTSKHIIPSYSRAPSPEFREFLAKEGFLAPLIGLSGREKQVENDRISLDVHLRSNDEIHVYCGLTRIVNAQLKKRSRMIEISAADTYKSQECSEDLFRRWGAGNSGFQDALIEYVDQVIVDKRWTEKEGKLQASWSGVRDPWTPFDREAVLSYDNKKESRLGREFSEVERARSLIKTIAKRPGRRGESWAKPSGGGRELDQLAIDSKGNLVLIEIKDASTSTGSAAIFYAPLQLLQYVHEWRHAFGWLSVAKDLQKLIEARQELGLTPSGLPELTGGIRAAVCFGEDKRSDEVKRRFYEALGVVNAHLPPNVQPIETWSYCKDGPHPL